MNFIEFMQHSYENFAGNVQYFHYTGLHPAEKVTINAVFFNDAKISNGSSNSTLNPS